MKKKILIGVSCIVIIVLIACVSIKYLKSQDKDVVNNANISIVTSLEDKIGKNTAWCGTFNLIWNDLKNDIAKQDIKFANNSDIIDNLNRGTFTTNELSEDSYYKTYGTPSLELKAEIEKAIKEKFNETSDILDSFNWEGYDEEDYFLYSMLKKDFEYPKVFDKLDNGTFEKYNNVRYFGIDRSTKDQVRDQVDVLYYNSEDDFALKIETKDSDEIIVSVGSREDNFLDIYNSIIIDSENYKGGTRFKDNDIFKMPYITFNLKEEIIEVENKPFYLSNGDEYIIEMALQTIEFELDEKGGRVKSEAGMMVKDMAAMPEEPRRFNVDQAFTIFLIEEGKDLPYFAAKISDISSVQSDVQIIFNRNKENVTVEVLEDTVIPSGATIIVTDKNEDAYGWGKSYKVEQKLGDEWQDLNPISEMSFEEIAYELDENGQFKQNIEWSKFYGKLDAGMYRIVKETYDKGYIYFYSNEFEIK